MDEASVARVDADVIDLSRGDTKEDQVSRRQSVDRNGLRCAALESGSARHIEPLPFVRVVHETTAIEAFARLIAPIAIRRADELSRVSRDARAGVV
jgi:hypothetical protein